MRSAAATVVSEKSRRNGSEAHRAKRISRPSHRMGANMRVTAIVRLFVAFLPLALVYPAHATTVLFEDFSGGTGVFTNNSNVYLTNGNNLTGCCGATGTPANMSNEILAFDGGNQPGGSIATSPITLVASDLYTLTLDYGAFGDAGLVDPLTITIGGYSFLLTPAANDNFDTNRTTVTFEFVGDGTTTPLQISSSGADNVDAFVDNISLVSSSLPEPSTWAMMLLGLGAVGLACRRERDASGRTKGWPGHSGSLGTANVRFHSLQTLAASL
jgi:PEP-CTERM motif